MQPTIYKSNVQSTARDHPATPRTGFAGEAGSAPNLRLQRLHMGVPHAVTIHLGKLDHGNPEFLEFLKICRK